MMWIEVKNTILVTSPTGEGYDEPEEFGGF